LQKYFKLKGEVFFMTSKDYPVSRQENLVVQELAGEILIYDLKNDKAFCLNETSALVWQECDGNKSIEEIGHSVSQKLNLPVNKDLVWLALDQLKKENLLENAEATLSGFYNLSRREAIKKTGLTSMVALPAISSIVAPAAISAQSGACIPGGTAGDCTVTPCCSDGSVCAVNISGITMCLFN
jgi:hypothetical protein